MQTIAYQPLYQQDFVQPLNGQTQIPFNYTPVQTVPVLVQPTFIVPYLPIVNTPSVYFFENNHCQQIEPVASGLVDDSGNFIAPAEGHSFVDYDYFQQLLAAQGQDDYDGDVESCASDSGAVSRSVTPAPEAAPKKKNPKQPKYAHRSKQKRIDAVHAEVVSYYTDLGLHVGDKEVLRGNDTVRIHVKTFHGLNEIKKVLEEVRGTVVISKMSTPISMKNKFQKKGFIVYLKLASEFDVPTVQSIFAKYAEHFKKCEVAKAAEQIQAEKNEKSELFGLTGFGPLRMEKQSSTGFLGA